MISKILKWVFTWFAGSLLLATVLGTGTWFILSMFGADLVYFRYIRGWFITILVIDIILDLWLWNRRHERGYW